MKHAAAKEKAAGKIVETDRTIAAGKTKKIAVIKTISPVKNGKTKAADEIPAAARKISFKEKSVEAAPVVSESKTATTKIVPVISGDRHTLQTKKTATPADKLKLPTRRKTIAPSVSSPANKLATQTAIAAAQKIKRRPQKPEEIASTAMIPATTHRIASAINVGKINAALKAIEEAQSKANQIESKEKSDRKKAAAKMRRLAIAEAETKAATVKIKPKTAKQIGAAVFRGRKNRYDFQVFPLDFQFENVPAIYVISRRKTDSKKRAHHAFVCIGQTDSLLGELEKHTQSKCVTRHEANVISILPERSEKKRLKIEEDLKAAHAIVCTVE